MFGSRFQTISLQRKGTIQVPAKHKAQKPRLWGCGGVLVFMELWVTCMSTMPPILMKGIYTGFGGKFARVRSIIMHKHCKHPPWINHHHCEQPWTVSLHFTWCSVIQTQQGWPQTNLRALLWRFECSFAKAECLLAPACCCHSYVLCTDTGIRSYLNLRRFLCCAYEFRYHCFPLPMQLSVWMGK